jgi:hypothetical protein
VSKFVPRFVVVAALSLALSVFAATISAGLVTLSAVTSAPIPVQSGYDESELFCGPVGEVQYVAIGRKVELRLILTPIKASRQYLVDWRNNKVRGYTIGVFSTDRLGVVRRRFREDVSPRRGSRRGSRPLLPGWKYSIGPDASDTLRP